MSDILNDLNALLFKSNTLPMCMYGKYSRLGLQLRSGDYCLQLSLAKCLDPNRKMGKVSSGEQVYDNDNQIFFTLSVSECFHILNNIKDVIVGKYENPNPECDAKYKNLLQITHYDEKTKKASRLTFAPEKGAKLKMTITSASGDYCSYIFQNKNENPKYPDPYELSIFINLIKSVTDNSVYDSLSTKANIKMLRQMYNYYKNDNGQSQNNKQQYNNSNYSKPRQNKVEQSDVEDGDYSTTSVGDDVDVDALLGDLNI